MNPDSHGILLRAIPYPIMGVYHLNYFSKVWYMILDLYLKASIDNHEKSKY